MQITQASLSNANEEKFMLLNEPFQFLFIRQAPSFGV